MSRFVSQEAGSLAPYTPGEQPVDLQYVKLNTNESNIPNTTKVVNAVTRERHIKQNI